MYTPIACEVLFAAEGITPAGKIAGVTSDQVRAALVRLTGKTIDGAAVTAALKATSPTFPKPLSTLIEEKSCTSSHFPTASA